MANSKSRQIWVSFGEAALLIYLASVILIALLRALFGWPTVNELASSPALLGHGQWWRLFTSAFVVEGPIVPQLVAIGVLGSLGIYIGGSWLFWSSALSAHLLGTLLAYMGFIILWFANHSVAAHYLTDPDYGVSLVWCAALGVFTAMAWLGERPGWRWPVRPWLVVIAIAVMFVVVLYSDDMAAAQHSLAYVIGFGIMAAADRSKIVRRERSVARWLMRKGHGLS